MAKPKFIGEVSPEQILDWKKEHGQLFGISVDGHICYLKKPDRKILSYASVAGKTDNVKFNEAILKNCFLGGSEAIKTEDDLFLGVCTKLSEIIQFKEAELINF